MTLQGRRHSAAPAAAAAPGVRPGAESAVAGMTVPKAELPDAAGVNGGGGGGAAPGRGGDVLGSGVNGLPDVVFDGGYRIPGDIYARLFDYQKTGAAGRAPCPPCDLLLCTFLSHI